MYLHIFSEWKIHECQICDKNEYEGTYVYKQVNWFASSEN